MPDSHVASCQLITFHTLLNFHWGVIHWNHYLVLSQLFPSEEMVASCSSYSPSVLDSSLHPDPTRPALAANSTSLVFCECTDFSLSHCHSRAPGCQCLPPGSLQEPHTSSPSIHFYPYTVYPYVAARSDLSKQQTKLVLSSASNPLTVSH